MKENTRKGARLITFIHGRSTCFQFVFPFPPVLRSTTGYLLSQDYLQTKWKWVPIKGGSHVRLTSRGKETFTRSFYQRQCRPFFSPYPLRSVLIMYIYLQCHAMQVHSSHSLSHCRVLCNSYLLTFTPHLSQFHKKLCNKISKPRACV